MNRAMRKVLACVLALVLALSAAGALAAEYPSGAFRLPAVKARPTETPAQPTEQTPAETPAEQPAKPTAPSEAPAAQPSVEPAVEPTEAPAAEPSEQPAEAPAPEATEQPSPTGTAVVVLKNASDALNVRAAANKSAERVATLKHGEVVEVYGASAGWTQIRTANGVMGYVASSYLKDSAPAPTEEPVVEPTEEPTAEPTKEPVAEPTEEPTVEPTEEPTEEPTAEPTEEPAAEPTMPVVDDEPAAEAELKYSYQRDESGALILDEAGNPIAIVPEGMEVPLSYLRDENGQLILDENGDPIVKDTVPENAEIIVTLEDKLNPERYIDVYMSFKGDVLFFGEEATLIALLYGYDNAEYALQWQTSQDGENWEDIPGATESRCGVVVTEENYRNHWQIQVTITDVSEDAPAAADEAA